MSAVEDETLHEAVMGLIMERSTHDGGMTFNLAEVADALVMSLCWTLSFSPDLETRRDFKKAGEFWGKEIASGIGTAKEFNRENGLLDAVEMGRPQ